MAKCPRKIMLLAEGGYQVSWDCGEVRAVGKGSGEWPFIDMRVLDSYVFQDHEHRTRLPSARWVKDVKNFVGKGGAHGIRRHGRTVTRAQRRG